MKLMPVTRALISVSDKTGIVEFAQKLSELGVEILSTGGTYKTLNNNNIPVKSVDSYTGHPEIMDGRVKTLHPRVHGGILAIRDNPVHREQMDKNGIKPIDLVVVNLYPFQKTVANPDVSIEDAIENIDIGGPTMVRSSAKNHAYVTIVVDPSDYKRILDELIKAGGISFETRKRLAVKAFRHTADYDAAIDKYLSRVYLEEDILRLSYNNGETLIAGENPHQKAVFYKNLSVNESSVSRAVQLLGKELSYSDIVGADLALECIKEIADFPSVAVIRNATLSGLATAADLEKALEVAWNEESASEIGSIVAFSRIFSINTAKVLQGKPVELLIAPDFTTDAIEFFKNEGSSIKLLATGELKKGTEVETVCLKQVTGGLLWQTRDKGVLQKCESVTRIAFPEGKEKLACFAMVAAKHAKSNAIILAQECMPDSFMVAGVGSAQSDPKDALKLLAFPQALERLKKRYLSMGKELPESGLFPETAEMVMASDLPLSSKDIITEAYNAGIRYIVQPGGSEFDKEIIKICDRLGLSMLLSGMSHFSF
jgi:phosphoribosylaminoimidazolecarboxamide formyltransferase/IMP cyclohydrolase